VIMDYSALASSESINKTMEALKANGIEPILVQTKAEALEKIKAIIPPGASVMNGSSVTLEQIGFVDHLKANAHGWNNLHAAIVAEPDKAKQAVLRKQALLSDYYLGSVHALAESGEFLIASNTGSQLPHVVFSSQNVIFVVGTQKIVSTLSDAFKRLEEHVVPLEDKHMQEKYGMGTMVSKILVFRKENPMVGRKVHLLLVNEQLGF
jgi:L-lactate utilization protein LutB